MLTIPAAVLLAVRGPWLPWLGTRFLPDTMIVYLLGLLMVVAGLAFAIWARVHLGRNWSGTVTVKENHELIRSGPYAIVRHPIYTGLLLAVLGTAIVFGEWRGLLAFCFLTIALSAQTAARGTFHGGKLSRYISELSCAGAGTHPPVSRKPPWRRLIPLIQKDKSLSAEQPDVLLIGPLRPVLAKGFADFAVHQSWAMPRMAHIRAMAVSAPVQSIDDALLATLPKLQIISSFGVGYDHIDANAAAKRGIVVTHTPDVLTEEVADTAIGLLLNTVRELPQSERYLRAGKWPEGNFPLSRATLRDRTVGMVGLGRIGIAIARRLEAFGVPVVYHTRQPRPELGYRHYPRLVDMAHDVDTLIVIVPGGAATKNMIDAESPRSARPEWDRDQCRARVGDRRAGVNCGSARGEDFGRWP